MMGMITASMVVTRADRRGKAKSVQPGNREWATVIECVNSGGWCIPPFVIVKGAYHLASWTTESGFPGNWVIKPTANGWTDNQTGLDWIKHFDKHTKNRTKGVYRMLIIDGHESHLSAEFDDYCKQNNIITVSMPAHSSHLLQPLDIALYSPLKRAYGDEINLFIRASINHITKSEFFIAFHQAHNKVFNEENIRSAFQGAGISPWDPDHVIKKLDVHLRTPTPPIANPSTPPPWQSQTPTNPQQTVSQSNFIKGRISAHQGSSPTPIIAAVEQLSKGAQAMAHSITILTDRLRTLEDANVALAKRQWAKRSRVQLRGALSIEESQDLLE
ncbi:pogo transposable element with krab domain [Colletotrichum chrysophilum]|uniref:Pogo transposable element with krab domain n=1 Tax=Colletotrichum chrysophilum TaxID=1836956 RepID=A0AAD9AC22_9PEZI|nr:pogo transposable element with krab domain [Colletotrichum chrysophilum]